MNCEDNTLKCVQNPNTQWGITLEIKKTSQFKNNCGNCPHKQVMNVSKKISEVN